MRGSRENGKGALITAQDVAESLQLKVTLTDEDGLGRIPEWISALLGEVWDLAVVVDVVVVHGAHHFDTIGELLWVPHVEVTILAVVNLDLEDTLLSLEVAEVWHLRGQLRVESDVTIEVGCHHIGLTDHGQDLLES